MTVRGSLRNQPWGVCGASVQVVDDHGLLRFVPLHIEDKHSVRALLRHVDKANGCGASRSFSSCRRGVWHPRSRTKRTECIQQAPWLGMACGSNMQQTPGPTSHLTRHLGYRSHVRICSPFMAVTAPAKRSSLSMSLQAAGILAGTACRARRVSSTTRLCPTCSSMHCGLVQVRIHWAPRHGGRLPIRPHCRGHCWSPPPPPLPRARAPITTTTSTGASASPSLSSLISTDRI